jgi:hypothetical protein
VTWPKSAERRGDESAVGYIGRSSQIWTENYPFSGVRLKTSPVGFTVGKGLVVENHHFRGAVADALVHQVTFHEYGGDISMGWRARSTDIPFLAPKRRCFDLSGIHRVEQVAASVAYLLREHRKVIRRVVLNPLPNPDDQHKDDWLGEPFVSFMTASADGTVTVYPCRQRERDGSCPLSMTNRRRCKKSLLHEACHLLAYKAFDGAFVSDEWEDAMHEDLVEAETLGVTPSARRNAIEDVAETLRVYYSVMYTDLWEQFTRGFPSRLKVLQANFYNPDPLGPQRRLYNHANHA